MSLKVTHRRDYVWRRRSPPSSERRKMLDQTVYKERIERVQEFLREREARLAVLTPSPNFEYLTGIRYEMRERLIALIVPSEENPIIVAPAFEVSNLSAKTWIDDFLPWSEEDDPYRLLAEATSGWRGRVAMFDDHIPLGVFWAIRSNLTDVEREDSVTPLLVSMRLHKEPAEVELMKRAGHIIDAAVMKAFSSAHVGMTEIELRNIIRDEIVRFGGVPTFAAVQFGENSAIPHAEPSSRELRRGDIVLLDCGCSVDGYNTDMTRVAVVGEPSDEQQRVYSVVLRAQETALERIAPGVACGTADGFARKVIEEEGFGEYFTHRLGHGIGLEVHEPPYLVRGNAQELAPGMTHSVEPGIYLESKFGVRIEDLVVITEDSSEVITYSPKDFYEISVG